MAAHEYRLQRDSLQIKHEGALVFEAAGFVKADSSEGRVNENFGEQGTGDHLLHMFEKRPADAAAAETRIDIQKPDLVHIQTREPKDPALLFVYGDVIEPGALGHTLRLFAGADFGPQGRRI